MGAIIGSILSSSSSPLVQDVADASLQMTAVWSIGEFGEMLLQGAGEGSCGQQML